MSGRFRLGAPIRVLTRIFERVTKEYLTQYDVAQSMREVSQMLNEQRYRRSASGLRKDAERETKNASNGAIFLVPSQRNRKFIAREKVIHEIERRTFPGSRLAL